MIVKLETQAKFWQLRDEILRRGVKDFNVGKIHIYRKDFAYLGEATVSEWNAPIEEWMHCTAEDIQRFYDEAIEAAEKMLAGLPEPTGEAQ